MKRKLKRQAVVIGTLVSLLTLPNHADAQSLGDLLKRAVRDAARRSSEQRRAPLGSPDSGNPWAGIERQENERANRARVIAEKAVDDTLFLPANYEGLGEYLEARQTYAQYLVSKCDRDRQREMASGYGYRPSSQEERSRRGAEIREKQLACGSAANSLDEPLERLRGVISQWAEARPFSYAGLHELSDARATYRFAWRVPDRDISARSVREKVIAVAEPILSRRTDVVEAALRPKIMSDLRKPGSGDLLEDLFVGDKARRDRYASAVQQVAVQENKASLLSADDPATRMAVAATAAFERAPQFNLGRSMGLMTNEGTKLIAAGGINTFSFSSRNATCRANSGAQIACSYQLRLTYSLLGISATSEWVDRKDIFRSSGGALRSPSLDTFMAGWAERIGANSGSASKSSECGNYRTYYDLSSTAPQYSYECRTGGTPDR